MKRQVSVLLDTRRSLLAELDASRREASRHGDECETLRNELRDLKTKTRSIRAARVTPEATHRAAEELRIRLAAERRETGTLERERDALERRATGDEQRLRRALDRTDELTVRYQRAEARRDAGRGKLDEAVAAMGRVRGYLLESLAEQRAAGGGGRPSA